jgi:PAS domain S-box-containing protein
LGKISSLLVHAGLGGQELESTLRVLCRAVAARGAAVYRKWYEDSKDFRIDCLAHWSAGTSTRTIDLASLESKDIPESCWEKLAARETVCLEEYSGRPLQTDGGVALVALFLVENLSGGVWGSGMGMPRDTSARQGLQGTLIPVFELWLSKVDAFQRWDDLLQFLPNPTFIESTEGKIIGWNKAEEELTGWKAERIIGKDNYTHALPFYNERRPTCSDLIMYPDPEWESRYLDLRREGDHLVVLAYCPNLPGGGAFLTGKTGLLYNITGRVRGSIHTVRDVTRERQIEKSLHQSEAIYRAITNFAGFGILFFTEDSIQYYNEYFSELMGIPEGKVTLGDITGWIHPEDRNEVVGHFHRLFRMHGKPSRFEFRAQRRESLHHYAGYAQMLDYEGKPTICFVLNDTTEQKELARKARLNEMKVYHEGRLTSLGIMAAGIAHELNQPLNTIRVITDGLLFGRERGWGLDPDEL